MAGLGIAGDDGIGHGRPPISAHRIGLHQARRGGGAQQAASDRGWRRSGGPRSRVRPPQIMCRARADRRSPPRQRPARPSDGRAGWRAGRTSLEMAGMEQRRVNRRLQVHPPCTSRRNKISCHWSCWSPPGVPKASDGLAAAPRHRGRQRRARPSARCQRGRQALGQPEHLRAAEFSGIPRPGTTGEDCSQPPDGVAETMLPQRSITSICTVSPRFSVRCAMVGSPAPAPGPATVSLPARLTAASAQASKPAICPGRCSSDAVGADQRRGVRRHSRATASVSIGISVWAGSP